MNRRFALALVGLAVLAGCVNFNTPAPVPTYQMPSQLTPAGASNPTAPTSDTAAKP